ARMVAEFDKRRKFVVAGLNKLPGISCVTPKGAFYAFPNIKRTGWKAKALASALLEDAGVALIGGPDFGILGGGYMRVSYANSTGNIFRAPFRIGAVLTSRKAAEVSNPGASRAPSAEAIFPCVNDVWLTPAALTL